MNDKSVMASMHAHAMVFWKFFISASVSGINKVKFLSLKAWKYQDFCN